MASEQRTEAGHFIGESRLGCDRFRLLQRTGLESFISGYSRS